MEIMFFIAAFFAGYFTGKINAATKDDGIYQKEYGIINGLMAPQKRK